MIKSETNIHHNRSLSRYILTLISLLFTMPFQALAQGNVGIGIAAPTANLEVHDPSKSSLIISTDHYNGDTSMLVIRNMIGTSTGTEFILNCARRTGCSCAPIRTWQVIAIHGS